MDASGTTLFPARALMGVDLMTESREALEANIAVTAESSRAFWNGVRAVGEELGAFVGERVQRQCTFAEGLLDCLAPAAMWSHIADYWRAEAKAWDAEQSRLMGLFARAMTDTMLEADSISIAAPLPSRLGRKIAD